MSPSAETAGYQVSVKFYEEASTVLVMTLLSHCDMGSFTLYFLAFDRSEGASAQELKAMRFNREGMLELTHNHGTESDESFGGYASGNMEPGHGFGHFAITVPDVARACARFEALGVQFKKKPTDGKMSDIAFILDPDGYWIEIVPPMLVLGPGDE